MRVWQVGLVMACAACSVEPPRRLASEAAPAPPSAGAIEHQVYVWQRVWTSDVQAAVDAAEADFSDRILLAVETERADTVWTGLWSADGRPVRNPPADWSPDAARALGRVSLALRWAHAPVALRPGVVEERVAQVLRRAAQLGWTVRSVHLDADIPTARLSEWAAVLDAVTAASPVPVTVLALVDHVDKPGWADLTRAVDAVVLQVHSVPLARADRPVLFDPDTARRAVSAAVASSRSPVLVALPTHTLTDVRTGAAVRAEPSAVVDWLDAARNPVVGRLTGVAWFRLPVRGATDTWTAEAFAQVRAGRVPSTGVVPSIGAAPAEWAADAATRAVYLTSGGPDHAWLPTLEVCVPAGRLAVVPMDARYLPPPISAGCVTLAPGRRALLAPEGAVPVALVLAEQAPEVRLRDAPTQSLQ